MSIFKKVFKKDGLSQYEQRLKKVKTIAEATRDFLRDVSSWQVGRPLDKEFSTDEAIKDGLKKNIWVYACCEKIAPDVASVPFLVEKRNGEEWEEDKNHELNTLLEKPFQDKPLASLIRRGELHLLLGGNAIIYHPMVKDTPKGMQPLHPGRVKAVPDGKGGFKHYERQIDGVFRKIDDSPESILHVMYEDPDSMYWGLGKYQAATNTVAASTSAVEWNMNLLKNSVGADLAITIEQYLQPKKFGEEVEKLNEMYGGAENAGKPFVFDAGAKVQELGRTPKEMDFTKSQEQAMYSICAAFGVDPRLIGAKEFSGRGARQEAERAYWIHTVIPEIQLWADTMTSYYQKFYGEDIRISYDLTNVEALQEEFKEKVTAGKELFNIGVPLDEINRRLELGLNVDDITGADSPFGLSERSKKRGSRELMWRRKDGQRRIWENRLAQEFAKGLKTDAYTVAEGVTQGKRVQDMSKKLKDAWEKRLAVSYEALVKNFGEEKYDELINTARSKPKHRRDFQVQSAEMARWIREISAQRSVDIADTTIETLGRIVADSVEKGEGFEEAARRIKEQGDGWTEDLDKSRAMVIARTEAGAGINKAAQEARIQLEKEFNWTIKKEWVASFDSRTRDAHSSMDGETVKANERYSNGLKYPGDPGGRAEQVINCRCTETETVENN